MRNYTFNAIKKLPHLSDFTFSDGSFNILSFVIDLGLYDAVIIDTRNCSFHETNTHVPYGTYSETNGKQIDKITVSNDVKMLNQLINFNKSVMLPCPECKTNQAFLALTATNPRYSMDLMNQSEIDTKKNSNLNQLISKSSIYLEDDSVVKNKKHSAYDVDIDYIIGVDSFQIRTMTSQFINDNISNRTNYVAERCVEIIMQDASELRKDFVCPFDAEHRISTTFIIKKAIDYCKKPPELVEFKKRKELNPSADMTSEEKNVAEQYEMLKYCLIIEKVGQEPSMADMQLFDIEKYRKVLTKERFSDFTMALGLFASGVGCGSLLYLRRIFESVVQHMADKCRKVAGWNEDEYKGKRFKEKLQYLENFGVVVIPNELADVKDKIYGLLSMGVHELSESEAKQLFPHLKFSIEIILDNQIHEKERADKIRAMKTQFNSL